MVVVIKTTRKGTGVALATATVQSEAVCVYASTEGKGASVFAPGAETKPLVSEDATRRQSGGRPDGGAKRESAATSFRSQGSASRTAESTLA